MLTLAPVLTIEPSPVALLRSGDVAHPERALDRGELVRVRPGVYAPASARLRLRPWERYLARVHAVARLRPDAVFCHESAAALLGLPIIGDPRTVHVLVSPADAARQSAGIRSHRTSRLPDVTSAGGLVLTTPGVTAVTIARHRHPAVGLATADAALRRDITLTPAELRADNERRVSSRGRNTARWSLLRADGARESVLESVSAAVMEWLGCPAPDTQRAFVSDAGELDRGDFWWGDIGLVGEPDGEFKYDGRFGDPAQLLSARRERDRRLLRGEARAVAHWGWIEVARVWPLRDLLLGHGLPQVRSTDHAPLLSLMHLLTPYDRELTPTRAVGRPAGERTSGRRGNG
ncbi:hypothetical protein N3K63_09325 [Microbacterium sp. W1N]|uniref:type IV toxin-antitoxin system AbiEi family antitoxin domain-containing protein n=1 Tax=Microbacterium festucae TaxID=2977531 RepID=UPI0021C1C5CE|nr:hypothetical protein [Microbacterium festucae]MCT9820480.1 hypothetical protein [Microbacterium festucae]